MPRPVTFVDRPLIPIVDPLPDGDFLLPVCLNADEFQSLLSALHGYQNLSADYDPATYQRVLEAWEVIRLSCNAEDGPPYWSSVDDAEGDFSYGELSGWDRFGTWLITGFMMYLTSPVGGLVFRHYATRVQLRYRQDGWGGVFRVLINGIEIDEVDTSGVTAIKELIYDLSDILGLSAQQVEPYTLTLERIDTDPSRMIALYRGYIHAPEVETDTSNWILNWNADLGTVELRKDGVTVDDVDVYDIVKPVWDDVVTPPPYTAPEPPDIPCSAATRAANNLRSLVWEPLYNRHQQSTGFLTWVFATFSDIVQNPIAAISSGLYGDLWTALNNGISLDSDDWEYVRCVFYRHLPASGLFDDDVLSDIASELVATSEAKFIALSSLITAMRWNGINYIERVDPDYSADCQECDEIGWVVEFDFTTGAPAGWTAGAAPPGINPIGGVFRSDGLGPTDLTSAPSVYATRSLAATFNVPSAACVTRVVIVPGPTRNDTSRWTYAPDTFKNGLDTSWTCAGQILAVGMARGGSTARLLSRIESVIIHGYGTVPTGGTLIGSQEP